MAIPKVTDAEFIELWEKHQSPIKLAKILQVSERCVYSRRRRLEARKSVELASKNFNTDVVKQNYRNLVKRVKGSVLIFSDAHVWSDEAFQPAYWCMLKLIKELQPSVIVANGDIFDCASISRFPSSGDDIPTLKEELEIAKIFLLNIEKVAPKNCSLIFTIGNHDQRWAVRLANAAKEFKGIEGFDFQSHFPSWDFCWSLVLNEGIEGGETLIKHRMNGGIHSAYNNVLRSGIHVVTGHSHALRAVPYNAYNNRRRWAVECGMLSALPINAKSKFLYAEDNVSQNTVGFTVLTYDEAHKLLPPELVEQTQDERVIFRGKELTWKK